METVHWLEIVLTLQTSWVWVSWPVPGISCHNKLISRKRRLHNWHSLFLKNLPTQKAVKYPPVLNIYKASCQAKSYSIKHKRKVIETEEKKSTPGIELRGAFKSGKR